MIRVLIGAVLAAGLYWGWQQLPTAEEREASAAKAAAEREQERLTRKADYVRANLPQGCTIDHLPGYGPVENIVLVRCEAQAATTANAHWQETRLMSCGKSVCPVTDDKHATTISVEDTP